MGVVESVHDTFKGSIKQIDLCHNVYSLWNEMQIMFVTINIH